MSFQWYIYRENMKYFTFEEVWPHLVRELTRLHRELVNALENAKAMERSHPELERDAVMFASWVRAYLVNSLRVRIDDSSFALERGFNLSITLKSQVASTRVYKASHGGPPQPKSPGQKTFFNQGNLQTSFQDNGQLNVHAQNFVVSWVTDNSRSLSDLILAYPRTTERSAGGNSPQEWEWIESIFDRTKPNLTVLDSAEDSVSLDIPDMKPVASVRVSWPAADIPGVQIAELPRADDEEMGAI